MSVTPILRALDGELAIAAAALAGSPEPASSCGIDDKLGSEAFLRVDGAATEWLRCASLCDTRLVSSARRCSDLSHTRNAIRSSLPGRPTVSLRESLDGESDMTSPALFETSPRRRLRGEVALSRTEDAATSSVYRFDLLGGSAVSTNNRDPSRSLHRCWTISRQWEGGRSSNVA
jgi:hypothetical protein